MGQCVATANGVAGGDGAVRIVITEDAVTIERPAERMRVPVVRLLIRHHASGRSMIVVVIGTPGVTVTDIELSLQLRVAATGAGIAAALFTRIENRNAIDR